MSVDDVLDSTGLPEVSVRTAEALDRTVRRGREHVRRRRRFGGAAAAIVIVGLVGGLLSITGDDDPDHVVAGPTADDSDRGCRTDHRRPDLGVLASHRQLAAGAA
ncbi:MAG: hypothetical protein IPG97_08695 [Microthrixaceae bacterium]|nr:hypothetical protein [Microthrixaceae bacterium]